MIQKELTRKPQLLSRKGRINGFLKIAGVWVNERTQISKPFAALARYPVSLQVQKNALYLLGSLTLSSFMLQIFSGLLMTIYYTPALASAYNSVDYITYILPLGWLVRGIHVYNASVIFIVMFLHLLRTFFASAYKKPREITWLSGVLLLLVTVGFAFTGALLPWDQDGYWATIVGVNIAGSTPLVGEWIMQLMSGGTHLGQITLTRFYFVHTVIMPGILVALVALHLSQLRHGPSKPTSQRGKSLAHKFVPFYPNRMLLHALASLGLLIFLVYLSWNQRAPLDFPADPTDTNFTPRPEWYFLSLFQLLRYFPGRLEPIASQLIPALVIGGMILLPFLDRGQEHRPWRKPVTTIIAIFIVAMLIGLTLLAMAAE